MPNPNFVVFYNGVRELPEQMEMKLSDSLMEQKAEVIKMSIYEFDEEKEMAIIRADERGTWTRRRRTPYNGIAQASVR